MGAFVVKKCNIGDKEPRGSISPTRPKVKENPELAQDLH
jgi:hypothetical protein